MAAGALVAGTVVAGVVGTTGTASADAPAASWTIQQQYPPGVSALGDVACPSATDCFAVGANAIGEGEVLDSTDGGSDWSPQDVPSGVAELTSIACPSATTCYAVGFAPSGPVAIATTDGGSTWAERKLPKRIFIPLGISCPTTTQCWMVGEGVGDDGLGSLVLTTSNGGAKWRPQPLPTGSSDVLLNQISCPTTTDCWVVGESETGGKAQPSSDAVVLASTDGGRVWAPQDTPSGVADIGAITCPDASTCFASATTALGAGTVLATSDGGASWNAQTLPNDQYEIDSIACPSSLNCTAIGYDGGDAGSVLTTADGGSTWSAQSATTETSEFTAVACPTDSQCVIFGVDGTLTGFVLTTSDGGADWQGGSLPSGSQELGAISCAAPSDCAAIGLDEVVATADGGATWNDQTPAGAFLLLDVSCPAAADCFAVGVDATDEESAVLATTDGGATWTSETLPSGLFFLQSISCADAQDCVAIGPGQGIETSDGGTTWEPVTLPRVGGPRAIGGIDNLDCPSASECFLVGFRGRREMGVIYRTTDGGSSWKKGSLPPGTDALEDVSCASTSDCWALGSGFDAASSVVVTTDGGRHWSTQALPPKTEDLSQISCVGPSDCWAISASDQSISILEGRHDSPLARRAKITVPRQTASFVATTDGGTKWVSESAPPGVEGLFGISCPSASSCWATGSTADSVVILALGAATASARLP